MGLCPTCPRTSTKEAPHADLDPFKGVGNQQADFLVIEVEFQCLFEGCTRKETITADQSTTIGRQGAEIQKRIPIGAET